jgi:hypothetical protein
MVVFQDVEEVEEWLEPMDYITLWEAMVPYGVFSIAERDHCDELIASGTVKVETILYGIKAIARTGLIERFGLDHRRYETHITQGVKSVH